MNHELVRFQSVRDLRVGQDMHSAIGAWAEAQEVYLAQAPLGELLLPASEPLVVYDVGLGIGANAIALIEKLPAPCVRPVHLVSFENDLAGLRLGLEHAEKFPFLARNHQLILTLLERGQAEASNLGFSWKLIEGDFNQTLATAPEGARLVLYDFFSPQAQPELWTPALFAQLRQKLHPTGGTWISYCAASAVRRSLKEAGFRVSKGVGTRLKRETTVASWGAPT